MYKIVKGDYSFLGSIYLGFNFNYISKHSERTFLDTHTNRTKLLTIHNNYIKHHTKPTPSDAVSPLYFQYCTRLDQLEDI